MPLQARLLFSHSLDVDLTFAFLPTVLSTPAFKIKVIGATAGAQDDDDVVADVMAAASAKVVGALVKKHILQTVNSPAHCVQPSVLIHGL
jgi:hypothetical protein